VALGILIRNWDWELGIRFWGFGLRSFLHQLIGLSVTIFFCLACYPELVEVQARQKKDIHFYPAALQQ